MRLMCVVCRWRQPDRALIPAGVRGGRLPCFRLLLVAFEDGLAGFGVFGF